MSLMSGLLEKIAGLIPEQYKWPIAIKKASYTVGKLAGAALMMGFVGRHVGSKLTPDQMQEVQGVAGALTAATLEGVHDWLRLKYPDTKWL